MKKRLRKKLKVKEFTEFGIELDFQIDCKNSEETDNFIYEMMDFIDDNNFMGGGCTGIINSEYICSWILIVGTKSNRDNNLKIVSDWIINNPKITNAKISEFVDTNSEKEPEFFHKIK